MKNVVIILSGLGIVGWIWLTYYCMFSSWAKRRSKLGKLKYRRIMKDIRRHRQTEEVAIKAEMEAIEQQRLQQEATMAAVFQSLQQRRTAVDKELDKLIGSVSDPESRVQLRRELDAILATPGVPASDA